MTRLFMQKILRINNKLLQWISNYNKFSGYKVYISFAYHVALARTFSIMINRSAVRRTLKLWILDLRWDIQHTCPLGEKGNMPFALECKQILSGDDRGWDGWMASRTQRTWVWMNSGRWWRTGRPGVLRFMGSQRVRNDWATELNGT